VKLNSTAAVWPPDALPTNSQLLRPTAIGRSARSAALLSMARKPWCVYCSSASQWVSVR
jgi:hypothetical protein